MADATGGDRATVLVVDDQPDLADLYAVWLEDYDVRTAYSGEEAIRVLDEDVDVSLVDRLMPRTSGDEVAEHVREAGYDCRVAMVTGVEPDFDIIEFGFDEYLVKPVQREELLDTVETLLTRSEYDDQLRELFALASKRAALQTRKDADDLEDSDAYEELTDRIERLRADLDRTTDRLSARDFEINLRKLNPDSE